VGGESLAGVVKLPSLNCSTIEKAPSLLNTVKCRSNRSFAQSFPQVPESVEPLAYGPKCCVEAPELAGAVIIGMKGCVGAVEVYAYSGAGAVSELTNVVRSIVENVSSPTLLMSDVMRSVNEVVGSDVAVDAFAVPWMADTLLIPVTSNAVIARIDSFLRFIIFVFSGFVSVLKYMECYSHQYFRNSILSRLEISERRDCRIVICRRLILL